MNIKNLILTKDSLANGGGMILVSSQTYTRYENGVPTGEVAGSKYVVVLPKQGFEKLAVKIKNHKIPKIDSKEIESSLSNLYVDFNNFQVKIYTFNGNTMLSATADDIVYAEEGPYA